MASASNQAASSPAAYTSICSRRRRMVDRTVTDAPVLQIQHKNDSASRVCSLHSTTAAAQHKASMATDRHQGRSCARQTAHKAICQCLRGKPYPSWCQSRQKPAQHALEGVSATSLDLLARLALPDAHRRALHVVLHEPTATGRAVEQLFQAPRYTRACQHGGDPCRLTKPAMLAGRAFQGCATSALPL